MITRKRSHLNNYTEIKDKFRMDNSCVSLDYQISQVGFTIIQRNTTISKKLVFIKKKEKVDVVLKVYCSSQFCEK